ncbi:hypothetical protein Dimus_035492, partial [Dionaea muscipula]
MSTAAPLMMVKQQYDGSLLSESGELLLLADVVVSFLDEQTSCLASFLGGAVN